MLSILRRTLPHSRRSMATYALPELDYGYGDLEPVFPADLMELHHSKHHRAYVTNLNISADKLKVAQEKGDLNSIISLQQAIKFNGGSHINHSILWKNMAPIGKGGGEMPEGDLNNMINEQFGSLEGLQTAMNAACMAIQGSGWGWLGYDQVGKRLAIAACANQDPLQASTGLVPLLAVDIWEHAFYLKYKNVKPDYLKAIWKVVNWQDCANRLAEAKK